MCGILLIFAVSVASNFSSIIISLVSKSKVRAEQLFLFFIEAKIDEESMPDDSKNVTGTSET